MKTRIENLIKEGIEREQKYLNEHNEIVNILILLTGQQINGRTLNKKRLGRFKLSLQYGMFYIIGNYEHLIGYKDSETVISNQPIEKLTRGFDYLDSCHGKAAHERINQLKKLDIDLLVKIFSDIESNFDNLRVLFGDIERKYLGSFYNPIYYNILNSIFESKRDHEIKLSDFYFIRK